jgi:hypothetical protein
MPIFTPRKLATFSSPVGPRKPKPSFFLFMPRSGTALSENGEHSELTKDRESFAWFIRVGAPNVKDEPRGPNNQWGSYAIEIHENGRLAALALATGSAASSSQGKVEATNYGRHGSDGQ